MELFQELLREGFEPNDVSYLLLMKAYRSLGSYDLARGVHSAAVSAGQAKAAAWNLGRCARGQRKS